MARPAKVGLDYFPLDVGFLRDKKVRLLRAEFGASSVVFVLYVFCKAFEGDGYFLRWDKEEALIAADELREPPTYISEVLQGCLSRSLFDERVFQMFGVLTSAGIQRRYLRSCEKRDEIRITYEYWLLNVDDRKDVPAGIRAKLSFFEVSGGNKEVSSPGNAVDFPGNPQSKVKQSKVEKSKGKESPPAPHGGMGFGTELEAALSEWAAYKAEKGKPCRPIELRNLTEQMKKMTEQFGEAAVVELLRECMANGYNGIIWSRLDGKSGKTPAVQQTGDVEWMKGLLSKRGTEL